jgi:hypothetical protein
MDAAKRFHHYRDDTDFARPHFEEVQPWRQALREAKS